MSLLRIIFTFILFSPMIATAGEMPQDMHNSSQLSSILDPFLIIQQDFESNEISRDERAVLQITAIKWPEKLPEKYKVVDFVSQKIPSRQLTPAIIEIVTNWEDYSSETQDLFSAAFARQSTAFSMVSPSGFFRLHYDTTGVHAVSSTDSDNNGIPDFVDRTAAYLDTSLANHVTLGYLSPPSDNGAGGDNLHDIYFEKMSFYGYAVPEGNGPETWADRYSYLVMNRDFIGFPPNTDPEGNPQGAAKATAAHEFHHCVQFAYDAGEFIWFMEMDATYMEEIDFDAVNDNYNYLPTYMNFPGVSLMNVSLHMYASFIYELYLAQRFDTSLMVAMWDGAKMPGVSVFAALSDTLLGRYGWSQDSAFAEFASWNFVTAARDDGLHHSEAAFYPLVVIDASHSAYPTSAVAPKTPSGYASSYIQFFPGVFEGAVRISFDGDESVEWGVYLITTTSTNVHQIERMQLNPSTWKGSIEIDEFEIYSSITMVAVNLTEFGPAASFSYTAQIPSIFKVSSSIISPDTVIYSGGTRLFDYQVVNPAIVGDVYNIIVWDDFGWIVPDTIDRFIASGDSVVVSIPVSPPEGTPLDQISILHFMAQSKSESSVFDEQTTNALTVLQRGDVNFDGGVDIADLTYLIDFLFINFDPPPIPVVDAGDFDCEGTQIDIADLTTLIDHLFISFISSPCNPY